MAYSFFLSGNEFDRNAWLGELQSIYLNAGRRPKLPLSPLGCQLGDLYPNWHRERVWLHPRGGIGGVMIYQDDEQTRLEVSDGCATADLALAWELVDLGIGYGAFASGEDHEVLCSSDEEISRITHAVQATCWLRLVSEIQDAGELIVRLGDMLDLRVTVAEASDGSIELERRLIERMRRYSHAIIAGVMTPRDTTRRSFCIYSEVATLIPSSVEAIYIHVAGVRYFSKPILTKRFYDALAGRIEDLGDWIYVPAMDLSADLDLILSLKPDRPLDAGLSPGRQAGLSAADWARLAKAPCLVFIMMVSAEGSIDEKEIALFERLLNQPDKAPTPMVSKIIGITQQNIEGLVAEILTGETTTPMELLAIRELLGSGKIPTVDAKAFTRFLYFFAESVASASGGILGIGRISKREVEALQTLRTLLLLDGSRIYTNSAAIGSTNARP